MNYFSTANVDFDSLTRVPVFDGNTTVVPVEITITDDDDDVFEQFLETFTMSIVRDPNDPISEVIISPGTITVFIQDGDGKVTP